MSFELLPHTADLKARLRAEDASGLTRAAVDMARDLILARGSVEPSSRRAIIVERWLPPEERFFRFVRELFYLFDLEAFLPASAEADAEGWTLAGEPFDPERHELRYHVKALTRHGYRFRCEEDEACDAELVFDL